MSVGGSQQQLQLQLQVLQQDLQNELTTANQLLGQISTELQKIKALTNPGGQFSKNVKQNAEILINLLSVQKIDSDKVPQMKRMQIMDTTQNTNQNLSYQQRENFRIRLDSQ